MMPLNFTVKEYLAILAALPLVDVLGANSETQRRRNLELCLSVSEKLAALVDSGKPGSSALSFSENGVASLKPISSNELRVCSVAVQIANLYFSGLPLSLDADLRQDLVRYREVYPPLSERLSELTAHFVP